MEGWNYRATAPIDVNGVRAHNVGDLVPDENVRAHGWDKDGLVEKVPAAPKTDKSA